jgi:hypothetical protein
MIIRKIWQDGMKLGIFISCLLLCFPSLHVHARSNLTIQDIQVGFVENKTKIEFDLSKPMPLTVKEDNENNQIIVGGPEDTFWQIPGSRISTYGGFKQYKIKKNKEGWRQCIISLQPNTRVVGKNLVKKSKTNLFVIDLVTEEPAPPPAPEPQEDPPMAMEEAPVIVPEPAPQPLVQIKQEINTAVHTNKIKQIKVIPKEGGATWLVIRSEKEEYFDFQSIPSDQLLLVYLPKTNWPPMPNRDLGDYNIASYRLDETNPNFSILHIKTTKECSAIDQFMSPNADGTNNFVLVLADRAATPIETQRLIEKKMEAQTRFLDRSKYSVEAVVGKPQITESRVTPQEPAEEVVSDIENQAGPGDPFEAAPSSGLKIPEMPDMPAPMAPAEVVSQIENQGGPEDPFQDPPSPSAEAEPTPEDKISGPLFDDLPPPQDEPSGEPPPEWVGKAKELIEKNETKKTMPDESSDKSVEK